MTKLGMALVCPKDAVDCNQLTSITQGLYNITHEVGFKVGQVAVFWFNIGKPECISKPFTLKDYIAWGVPYISVNEAATQLKLWSV